MSTVIRTYIVNALDQNQRLDGRELDEFRKVVVEVGISKNAEGSARVKIGDTELLAGIKLAVEAPYPDTPDSGNLAVNTEFTPLSSPDFEAGPPGDASIEVARVTDRGIRESEAIDTKKLVITAGEKVWSVLIDIVTVNDAGNIMDASALAAIAALKNARFPKYENDQLDYKTLTKTRLPVTKTPIAVTVSKIGSHLLVDTSHEEEPYIEARLTVTTAGDGSICALQKGGEATLTLDEIKAMVELAKKKARELEKYLEA